MTCTCPTPHWLAEQEAREAERQRERRVERQLRKLTAEPMTADSLVRIMATLFGLQEAEVTA